MIVAEKADVLARLQREILSLQGYKPGLNAIATDPGLGSMRYAFPHAVFPTGAMHEFLCEDKAATAGFIAGILSSLMRNNGICVWIGPFQTLFPPALKSFGVEPDKIIFIHLKKEKDIQWAIEEVLKCDAVTAVVGELQELNFTTSRRFQLAVEQSRVTGFILRHNMQNISANACVARWKITSLPAMIVDDMPGIGFPRWSIELLKVRNGKPGRWQIEWTGGRFRNSSVFVSLEKVQQKKTG